MKKLWADRAWDDYLYWQMQDKKTLKRINELIKSTEKIILVTNYCKNVEIKQIGY